MLARRIARAIAAFAAAIALLQSAASPAPVKLIDQTGRAFDLGSLRGRPLIVTFVAAHCTDACPLVNAQFAQAQQMFADRHMNVRLLTITLDPEHDPPAVMRDLARRFDADPRGWLVAGGSVAGVHAVMALFGVRAQRSRSGYADVHTTFVYLFDRRGRLRRRLLASTALGTLLLSAVHSQWSDLTR